MKITGVRLDRHTMKFQPKFQHSDRSVGPLDMYPEYLDNTREIGRAHV